MRLRGDFACSLFFIVCQATALDMAKVELHGRKLDVEVVDDDSSRQKGLMFRRHLDFDRGMLFVFEQPQILRFWMKNTFIPLSLGYFDDHCKLIDIHKKMTPVASEMETPTVNYVSRREAVLALEVKQGWFTKNHISTGPQLHFLKKPKSALLKKLMDHCS